MAWGQQQNPNQIANSFLAQEAKNQISAQLQSKGLRLVEESENPDLIVVGSGGMKIQTSYTLGACADSAVEWAGSLPNRMWSGL